MAGRDSRDVRERPVRGSLGSGRERIEVARRDLAACSGSIVGRRIGRRKQSRTSSRSDRPRRPRYGEDPGDRADRVSSTGASSAARRTSMAPASAARVRPASVDDDTLQPGDARISQRRPHWAPVRFAPENWQPVRSHATSRATGCAPEKSESEVAPVHSTFRRAAATTVGFDCAATGSRSGRLRGRDDRIGLPPGERARRGRAPTGRTSKTTSTARASSRTTPTSEQFVNRQPLISGGTASGSIRPPRTSAFRSSRRHLRGQRDRQRGGRRPTSGEAALVAGHAHGRRP